jgi:hypothetical protein
MSKAMLMKVGDFGFDELYVSQIGHEREAFFGADREHFVPEFPG